MLKALKNYIKRRDLLIKSTEELYKTQRFAHKKQFANCGLTCMGMCVNPGKPHYIIHFYTGMSECPATCGCSADVTTLDEQSGYSVPNMADVYTVQHGNQHWIE